MVGKNAAEFLEQTYLLFFEPEFYWSEQYLGKFFKRKQDLELKHARRNQNRELTMRERHLLHILRCRNPVGKDGPPSIYKVD
jgi:hypothetical protein